MSVPKHHIRAEVCASRASYREGRNPKAVKVYTVAQESRYLLVTGVPVGGVDQDLIRLFSQYGAVEDHKFVDNYPGAEAFTDVYLIKFEKIMSARIAKRKLDDWSFFGGVLHVCYAPEHESVEDTREKLQERRKSIAIKTRQYAQDGTYSSPNHVNLASSSTQSHQTDHTEIDSVTGQESHFSSGAVHQTSKISNQSQANQTVNFNGHNYTPGNGHHGQFKGLNQNVSNSEGLLNQSSGVNNTHSSFTTQNYEAKRHKCGTVGEPEKRGPPHQFKGDNSVQGEDAAQLWLPEPPRHSFNSGIHGGIPANKRPLNIPSNNFARVPTANAVFPADFDARTDVSGPSYETFTIEEEEYMDEEKKTMLEKIDENLKTKTPIIKAFTPKPVSVPKFVPRQAQKRYKDTVNSSLSQEHQTNPVSINDNLDTQLRRDALKLTEVQGPIHPNREPRAVIDPRVSSVNNTVKDIRKRIKELTDTAIIKAKKARVDIP